MTANALAGDRERGLVVGMDDYMSKPVDPGKLRTALERALSVGPVAPAESVAADGTDPGAIWDAVKSVSAVGDDAEFAFDVLRVFLDSSGASLATLDRAVPQDAGAFARVAHSLKGSAGNIEARRMTAAAARLEAAARDGGATTAVVGELRAAWIATERQIRQYLADAPTDRDAGLRQAPSDRA